MLVHSEDIHLCISQQCPFCPPSLPPWANPGSSHLLTSYENQPYTCAFGPTCVLKCIIDFRNQFFCPIKCHILKFWSLSSRFYIEASFWHHLHELIKLSRLIFLQHMPIKPSICSWLKSDIGEFSVAELGIIHFSLFLCCCCCLNFYNTEWSLFVGGRVQLCCLLLTLLNKKV